MDSSDKGVFVALFLVVVMFGGPLAGCFWSPVDNEPEFTITGEVIGLSSYNQPKLDIKAEEVFNEGIGFGALFRIQTETETYENALLVTGYKGVFMFDAFVNVETDGLLSVGSVGVLISAEKGSDITLTKTGNLQRYSETPKYNAGQTDSRSDYPSDEVYANFYEVTGGDIKSGILYRSYSPLYDPAKQTRSYYINQLAEEVGINFEVALSYSDKTIADAVSKYDGYCLDLCKNGHYVAPAMGYLYFQQKEKTVEVLRAMLDNDGPYLIHCNAGRDRTGFVVLLLQSLCGCTTEEMMECEARAFQNLYHIGMDSEEYEVTVHCIFDRNMYFIVNPDKISNALDVDWQNVDMSKVDARQAAYSYCTGYLGMSIEEVDGLVEKLTS